MAFTTKVWSIDGKDINEIKESALNLESRLEDWVEKKPDILGINIAIIGRQIATDFGGFIDLLGIDSDGDLVILELKRNKTPRDVVAQILDYASWVNELEFEDIDQLARKHKSKSLEKVFKDIFDEDLPENINVNHKLIIVASQLDDSTERIVQYLYKTHKLNINAIFFTIFNKGNDEFLTRSWINDPEEIEVTSRKSKKSPWSGYLFVNTGIIDDYNNNWKFNLEHNFISAGGGKRWMNAIKKLKVDDKIFAYIKGRGYVGFGIVEKEAIPISNFFVDDSSILNLLPEKHRFGTEFNNLEMTEWFVKIKWVKTFNVNDAKTFKGIFANQNVVCKIRNTETFDFLQKEFEL